MWQTDRRTDGQTDGRTDRRTENTIHRAAWSQLKTRLAYQKTVITCQTNWWVLCQKQVWRAQTSNYIPQYLWDVITCPCSSYLLLAQHFPIKHDCFFACFFHTSIFAMNANMDMSDRNNIKQVRINSRKNETSQYQMTNGLLMHTNVQGYSKKILCIMHVCILYLNIVLKSWTECLNVCGILCIIKVPLNHYNMNLTKCFVTRERD